MAIIYYPNDSVILERNTTSASYHQIALSMLPNTIIYFDENSGINAISASIIYITSSNSISSSYAPGSPSISASYAVTSSYAPGLPSISASYSITSSYSLNSGNSGTTISSSGFWTYDVPDILFGPVGDFFTITANDQYIYMISTTVSSSRYIVYLDKGGLWKLMPYTTYTSYGKAAVATNDKLFMFGGNFAGSPLTASYYKDISNERGSNDILLSSMPSASYHSAGVIEGSNYIHLFGGGDSDKSASNYHFKYDISKDSWISSSNVSQLPVNLQKPFAVTDGNDVYIGSSYEIKGTTPNYADTSSFYKYNFSSDTFTKLTDLPKPGNYLGIIYNNQIYIVENDSNGTSSYYYDINSSSWNIWTNNAFISPSASLGSAVLFNNSMYIAIGIDYAQNTNNQSKMNRFVFLR